jgi:hypothetical protein
MDVDSIIRSIEQAVEEQGLPELSKRSGVPYTTLRDWQKAGWRPRAVEVLEKLAAASEPANDVSTHVKAA